MEIVLVAEQMLVDLDTAGSSLVHMADSCLAGGKRLAQGVAD